MSTLLIRVGGKLLYEPNEVRMRSVLTGSIETLGLSTESSSYSRELAKKISRALTRKVLQTIKSDPKELEKLQVKLRASLLTFSASYGVTTTSTAFAATEAPVKGGLIEAFWPLIAMLQEFAFPVAVAVSTWGTIELIIGRPEGKEKIKWAILGYVGVFLIPFLFALLSKSFSSLTIPDTSSVPASTPDTAPSKAK